MFALRAVEELDVNEGIAGFVCPEADAFAFEQVEEAARVGIIRAVPAAAHAGDQIVLFGEFLPLRAGELGTLVRMHLNLGLWFAPPDGFAQGLRRQFSVGPALH